jgi:hypothetical protein
MCRFHVAAGEDTPTSSLSGTLVRSVTKLASITFLSLAFSYWIDDLGFITEGKLDAVLITPSLGVPNWSVIYIINTAPWHRCRGERRLLQGESRTHNLLFCLLFCFTLFLLVSFYQKYKKI